MDIENLTKAQIILLTLLVSFITSIATGIVTVSLLEQAPKGVTQTINRVVERTVERVSAPTTTPEQGEIIKETTVVVREQDLISESIAQNAARLARVSALNGQGAFIGLGVLVSPDGTVALPAALVVEGAGYAVSVGGGAPYTALARRVDDGNALALLVAETPESVSLPEGGAVVLADDASLGLGQTAIALFGTERVQVSLGIVADIVEGAPEEGALERFSVTIPASANTDGMPVFNLFGELIGVRRAGADTFRAGETEYISAGAIKKELAAISGTD